jgi:hypothetical protein
VPDLDGIETALQPGEKVLVNVSVDGFHASEHNLFPSSPRVVITDRRFILFSKRGALRKRYSEDASWPLSTFTERINSNEGTALGPFMYFLTLFTQGGETISSAFRSGDQREQFKFMAGEAVGRANGWL